MGRIVATLSLAFLLFACIGCGGGRGNRATTPGQAQGVYSGTTTSGLFFDAIILPNDYFYARYGESPSGMMDGQGVSSSGDFTATITDHSFTAQQKYSGSLSGTYVPDQSFRGTVTESGQPTVSFSTAMLPTATLDFNAPATFSAIAGTWTWSDGVTSTMTIGSDGALSGTPFNGTFVGCSVSGTISPDSSGKNFYDISMTFSGSSCPVANQSGSGIILLWYSGTTPQLYGIGTLSGGGSFSFGSIFL